MGAWINGRSMDPPWINGKQYNAYIDGKLIWGGGVPGTTIYVLRTDWYTDPISGQDFVRGQWRIDYPGGTATTRPYPVTVSMDVATSGPASTAVVVRVTLTIAAGGWTGTGSPHITNVVDGQTDLIGGLGVYLDTFTNGIGGTSLTWTQSGFQHEFAWVGDPRRP